MRVVDMPSDFIKYDRVVARAVAPCVGTINTMSLDRYDIFPVLTANNITGWCLIHQYHRSRSPRRKSLNPLPPLWR